jgi:type IV fimbrial biogenesis protein FimT
VTRRNRRLAPARPGGFTLIEAMVVVALLAIVATIAAPSFRAFVGTMNTKSAAFDLISDFAFARSEAIKQNANTVVAPVGGSWSNGWTIVSGANTLRTHPPLSSAITVGGSPAPGTLTFRPNGRLGTDVDTANLAWRVESTIAGVTARCVVVTMTGAARSKYGAC